MAAALAPVHAPVGTRSEGRTTALAIVVTGTRHDVLPHIALAYNLKQAGFNVRLVSNAIHADAALQYDVAFVPLRGDPHAIIQSAGFRECIEKESMYGMASLFKQAVDAVLEENMNLIHAAIRDVDGILCSLTVLTECMAVGQKYQIPVILCPLMPFSPSGEIPVAHLLPEPSKWTWLNKLTYDLSGLLLWTAMGATFNKFRTEKLKIGPQTGFVLEGVPQLTAFNEIVISRPSDWGSHIHTSGMWHLPREISEVDAARRHPKLARLLSEVSAEVASRPIYIGFDAFPVTEPVTFIRKLHTFSCRLGIPFVFVTGSTDIEAVRQSILLASCDGIVWETDAESAAAAGDKALVDAAEAASVVTHVHIVREVPLMWVMSRCSMAIHHGSSLATQTALEAGIPNVIFPAFGEHYFWAARVSNLGVGPLIYHPFRSALKYLGEGIVAGRQPTIVDRAAAVGERIRGRGDGAQTATWRLKHILSRPQHRHCGVTCTWAKNDSSDSCCLCHNNFTLTNRRHHCRSCGRLIDAMCVGRCHLPGYPENAPQIVCLHCLDARRAFLAAHAARDAVPEETDRAATSIRTVALDTPTPTKPTRTVSVFDTPSTPAGAGIVQKEHEGSASKWV